MTTHHRHHWTETNESTWACEECTETTPTCIITDHPKKGPHPTGDNNLICPACLAYEHRVLDDIADALGHWQHQPKSLVPAIRYDRDRSETGPPTEQPFNHPRDITDVLWSWATMWAEATGDNATAAVLDHLKTRTLWAAHNPTTSAWHDYRQEIRQLRHHARRIAHLLPQRQNGPCVHCGGTVVRDWADKDFQPLPTGLSDIHRCTGCGITWGDREAWMYTNGHTLRLAPEFAPDTLVTIEDARKHIFPDVPASTWRTWLLQDRERAESGKERLIPERDTNVRGQTLYRVGDLASLVERRADDARRGPKVRRAG